MRGYKKAAKASTERARIRREKFADVVTRLGPIPINHEELTCVYASSGTRYEVARILEKEGKIKMTIEGPFKPSILEPIINNLCR